MNLDAESWEGNATAEFHMCKIESYVQSEAPVIDKNMQMAKKKYFSALAVIMLVGIFMVWQKGCGDFGYGSSSEISGRQGQEGSFRSADTLQQSPSALSTFQLNGVVTNTSFLLQGHQGNSSQVSDIQKLWPLEHGNCLSNFFYHEDNHLILPQYRSSNIVFLHHNKAGGSTIRSCIEEIAPDSHLKLGSLLVSYKHVNTVYELIRKGEANHNFRMGYMGGYSFGICDALVTKRPCSYFTMLRDPYERIISCYFFCQRSTKDQLCTALNAANVTLKEWALHQGSYFFNQVMIHPKVCQGIYDQQYYNLDGIQHDFWHGEAPCWFKQKVILSNYLTEDQEELILKYVVDHMQEWFAAVGIIEEFDLSLDMFQHVYGLPFKDRCVGKHSQVGKYKKRKKNITTVEEQIEKDKMVQQLKAELQADPEVRRALHPDLAIYEKVKEIFTRQKEVYFMIKNGRFPDSSDRNHSDDG